MTLIKYQCKGANGDYFETTSLIQAQEFVTEYGGEFKLIEEEHKSSSEGYAKKGYRRPNSRT